MRRINPKKVILDPSSLRPDRDGNGIDLAGWITFQINQGYINISGGDTHSFNTNLTTTAARAHTVANAHTYQIAGGTTDLTGIFISPNSEVMIGDMLDYYKGQLRLGAGTSGIELVALGTQVITLGDVNGDENGTTIVIDDDASEITVSSAGRVNLGLNASGESRIVINNTTDIISIINDTGSLVIDNDNENIRINSLLPITLGDYADAGNTTKIVVDDDSEVITINSLGDTIIGNNDDGAQGLITLSSGTGVEIEAYDGQTITLGDINGSGNSTNLVIDDNSTLISLNSLTGTVDLVAYSVNLGDTTADQNGTKITVDDNGQEITLESTSGVITLGDIAAAGNKNILMVSDSAEHIMLQTPSQVYRHPDEATGSLNLRIINITDTTLGTAATAAVTLNIPTGALVIAAQMNVDVAITTDAANNTWSAAFSGGSTATVAAAATAGAINTKVNTTFVPFVTTNTTNLLLTAGNGENFATGAVKVLVYYYELSSLANFGV